MINLNKGDKLVCKANYDIINDYRKIWINDIVNVISLNERNNIVIKCKNNNIIVMWYQHTSYIHQPYIWDYFYTPNEIRVKTIEKIFND